jgi:hypothetical protein
MANSAPGRQPHVDHAADDIVVHRRQLGQHMIDEDRELVAGDVVAAAREQDGVGDVAAFQDLLNSRTKPSN